MSTKDNAKTDASSLPLEYDFWDFVACARCHLPFVPESGGTPSVPFWVTECGHVICNNHLSEPICRYLSIPSIELLCW